MPAVKVLKTPDNAFRYRKEFGESDCFARFDYSVTGLTETKTLSSFFLLNSTSPSISAKRVWSKSRPQSIADSCALVVKGTHGAIGE